MDEKLICLQLGALLHDIGKIVRRAGLDKNEYSIAGSNYLKENNLLEEKYKEVYNIMNDLPLKDFIAIFDDIV